MWQPGPANWSSRAASRSSWVQVPSVLCVRLVNAHRLVRLVNHPESKDTNKKAMKLWQALPVLMAPRPCPSCRFSHPEGWVCQRVIKPLERETSTSILRLSAELSLLFSLTCPTISAPTSNADISWVIPRMSVLAIAFTHSPVNVLSDWTCSSSDVFAHGDRFKMLRVNTTTHSTQMIQRHSVRDRSYEYFVCHTVRGGLVRGATHGHSTVAISDSSRPQPAASIRFRNGAVVNAFSQCHQATRTQVIAANLSRS